MTVPKLKETKAVILPKDCQITNRVLVRDFRSAHGAITGPRCGPRAFVMTCVAPEAMDHVSAITEARGP